MIHVTRDVTNDSCIFSLMILYIVCVQAATSRRELYVYVDHGPWLETMTLKLHEECFANLKDIYRKDRSCLVQGHPYSVSQSSSRKVFCLQTDVITLISSLSGPNGKKTITLT